MYHMGCNHVVGAFRAIAIAITVAMHIRLWSMCAILTCARSVVMITQKHWPSKFMMENVTRYIDLR